MGSAELGNPGEGSSCPNVPVPSGSRPKLCGTSRKFAEVWETLGRATESMRMSVAGLGPLKRKTASPLLENAKSRRQRASVLATFGGGGPSD
jgi:hypothetical protein